MDKGYIDYERLYGLTTAGAFFLTRLKDNAHYRVRASGRWTNIRVIMRSGDPTGRDDRRERLPAPLRRVKYRDRDTQTIYEFLTNQMVLPALVITQLFKQRWQVELFFKWNQTTPADQSVYGTTANAVRIQVWTAITTYCLRRCP